MPGFNGMGPTGNGSMTGRRMGNCARTNFPGTFYRRGMGRNANFGAGFSRGRGLGFNQNLNYNMKTISPEEEKEFLNEQREFFQSQLSDIDKQLEEL